MVMYLLQHQVICHTHHTTLPTLPPPTTDVCILSSHVFSAFSQGRLRKIANHEANKIIFHAMEMEKRKDAVSVNTTILAIILQPFGVTNEAFDEDEIHYA